MGIEHWLLKAGFYCASEAFRRIESLEEVERVAGIEPKPRCHVSL